MITPAPYALLLSFALIHTSQRPCCGSGSTVGDRPGPGARP